MQLQRVRMSLWGRWVATTVSFVLVVVTCTQGLQLTHPSPAYALTSVSGIISQDTTWTVAGGPYRVTGTVTVAQGATLTIEPGAVIKFDRYVGELVINGRLIADGTETSPVYFTSIQDDSVGGDTNGDGAATQPAIKNWKCISLGASSTANIIDHAEIRYGSYSSVAALKVATNAHTITGNTFQYNGYPIELGANVTLSSSENTATHNTVNGVHFPSSVTSAVTCRGGDLPYVFAASTTSVESSGTLTLEGGPVIKFPNMAQLRVSGSLIATGTNSAPVYVTSIKDDTVGGDTNNDGAASAPAKGDWSTVDLLAASSDNILDNVIFRYACYYNSLNQAPLRIYTDSHTVSNCTFEHNAGYAMAMHTNVTPNTSGNTARDNSLGNGIVVGGTNYADPTATTKDVIWRGGDLTYVVRGAFDAGDNTTLTVEGGAILKCLGTVYIDGSLQVRGTQDEPVYFTSLRDDSVGGDTNNDATATTAAKGDWTGINFYWSTGSSRVDHARISYSGANDASAIYAIGGEGVTLHGCVIHDTKACGVETFFGDQLTVEYSDLYRTGSYWIKNSYSPPVSAGKNWFGVSPGWGLGFSGSVSYAPLSTVPYSMSYADARSLGLLGFAQFARYCGDPVNASTGNFYTESADISLPGKGPALAFKRTYNSQDAFHNGSLGYGWVHSYGSSLRFDEDGKITVIYPNATRVSFAPTGSGSYETSAGVAEHLAPSGSGYILRFVDGQYLTYDSNGRLTQESDRYGNALFLTYDSQSRLLEVEATDGRYLSFGYVGGQIATVSDSASRTVHFSYDTTGDLVAATDPRGNSASYAYDASHQMTQYFTPGVSQAWLTNDYYGYKVSNQQDARGNKTTFTYQPSSGRTLITDPKGNVVLEGFDEQLRSTSTTDALGGATHSSYNDRGVLETETDPVGGVTSYEYDGNLNQTLIRDAGGHETKAAYDSQNSNLLWTETALGDRTTYSYDASGTYLMSMAGPGGTISYDYYSDGLVAHRRSAGATTTFEYTPTGLLSRLIDPLGNSSTFGYDGAGRMTSATDADSQTTNWGYDDAGNVLWAADALENTATFAYDARGNCTSSTSQNGDTTSFSWDVMGNLANVTDSLSHVWSYSYDSKNALSAVTNPRSYTTTYTYDAADRLTSVEDALGNLTNLSYDAAGELTGTVFPDGSTVMRSYDGDGLLSSIQVPGEVSYDFSYLPTHRISSVCDQDGRGYSYSYDTASRLASATDDVDPGVSGGFTMHYAHDEAGSTTQIRASSEGTRTYSYDTRGGLIGLELPSDPAGLHTSFDYDRRGLISTESMPDGSQVSYGYDRVGLLSSLVTTTSSGVFAFNYTRDANGNVTAENDNRYGYDALGRLTSWYDPSANATTTYDYDAAYNLTGVSVDGSATKAFSFDAADRISSPGFAYDANGNMTGDGLLTYTYDALNRLSQVRDATGTAIATYTYDATNRRVSSTNSSATTYFHYDGASPNVVAETDGGGGIIASYAYDSAGRLHSMRRRGETYYYHVNGHGDVIALTDAGGEVVNSYRYDPWGRVLAANETVVNPYRYAGYRYDDATGLYQLWNRYYSPMTMRFITKDVYPGEIKSPGTLNGYAYCLGNPVNRVDPTGRIPWLVVAVLAVVVPSLAATAGTIAAYWPELSGANRDWSNAGAVQTEEDNIGAIGRAHSRLESAATKTPAVMAGWDAALAPGELGGQRISGCGLTGNLAHWPGGTDSIKVLRSAKMGSLPVDALWGNGWRFSIPFAESRIQ